MKMLKRYGSLHCHTDYSNALLGFPDAINKVDKLIQSAYDKGLSGISITEHEGISSYIQAEKYFNSMKKDRDFKLMFGNEIYLITEEENEWNKTYYEENREYYVPYYHFLLNSLDEIGNRYIRELSTIAWQRSYTFKSLRRRPTLHSDLSNIIKEKGHIIGSSACFTKGHLVYTENGYKKIEEISKNDKVYTLDGTFQKVLRPTNRQYKGLGYDLKFSKNYDTIRCTENHKFFTYRRNKFEWKEANKLTEKDYCLQLIKDNYSKNTYFDNTIFFEKLEKDKSIFSNRKYKIKKNFNITFEMARMFGLWLADGYIRNTNKNNSIGFSFNILEFEKYYDFVNKGINDLMENEINPYIYVNNKNNKVEITYNSVELVLLFKHLFNGILHANNKRVPCFLKNISKEIDCEILYGYLLGDGYFRHRKKDEYPNGEIVSASISEQLTKDIMKLYNNIGLAPNFWKVKEHIDKNKVKHREAYYLSLSCKDLCLIINKSQIPKCGELFKKIVPYSYNKRYFTKFNGEYYLKKKVTNISPIFLEEQVFCLEVENNHNFECNGIIVHNCLGSRISKLLIAWKQGDNSAKEKLEEFIDFCIDIFGKEYFFLEAQPCYSDNEEQLTVNRGLKYLSKKYGLKMIVTTDAHYLEKEDAIIHKAFLNSKDGGDSRETEKFYSTTYLMTPDELRKLLLNSYVDEEIDEMFENTNNIFELSKGFGFFKKSNIPTIPKEKIKDFKVEHLFSDYYSEFKNLEFYANSDNIYHNYFIYKLEQGMKDICKMDLLSKEEKYGRLKRLDFECGEIKQVGEVLDTNMESYFTTIQQIIDLIWTKGNSLVGVGRGSSDAFLINYVLGITQIDPYPLGDLFPSWRFLSIGRSASLADVDIDVESSKKDLIINAIKEFWGERHVLQCATFSKLTPKTAILKSGKGLNYNDDEINYLASLVPITRGKQTSLNDLIFGNNKKDIKPNQTFISELEKFPNLKECILALQGTISQMGIHAGAVNVMNEDLTETTSCMIAPNGNWVSAFDLHDEEYTGTVKFDLLSIDALQKIRTTMGYLLKQNLMEEQGTLRDTYNKYLHPSLIEYKDSNMWDLLPKTYSCFQWDTPVGSMGIEKIKPRTLMELTAGNSLIRLQGEISPLDVYVKYKNNIELWYQDMRDYGLTQSDIDIMKEYLLDSYGVMENQESCMRISMDKRISGFTLAEADKLRKVIAKADKQALVETEQKFYSKGLENNCNKNLLDYIWKVQINYSLGYAFSIIHSLNYSVIALQELNLAYQYNNVFWNTACLTVESQSDETNERSNNTDYSKIARAIYKMKKFDVDILPPVINKSNISFTPIAEENSILFGLGGISGINLEIAQEIINKRPYANFKDFYTKHKGGIITKSKFITLIKSGCFDTFIDRISCMKWLAVYESEPKTNLTLANVNQAIKLKVDLPQDLIKAFKFKQYVLNKKYFYCNDIKFKSKKHYIVEETYARPYFEQQYINQLEEDKDYYYCDKGLIVVDKALEKAIKPKMNELQILLKAQNVIEDFNKKQMQAFYFEMINYNENLSKWSFDSISFYDDNGHELKDVNLDLYNISNFSDLPEEPIFIEKSFKNRTWKQYQLYKICGTVIGRKDNNHLVDILTPDNEVVTVNVPKHQFSYYKKVTDNESNWFERGKIVMFCGYRRNDAFFVKKYKNSIYQHSVNLVEEITKDNELIIKLQKGEEI